MSVGMLCRNGGGGVSRKARLQRVAFAVLCMVASGGSAAEPGRCLLTFPDVRDTRLTGDVGRSADTCIHARTKTGWARGPMYEESVNAFASGWDHRRRGWQNEYWGKTMLCTAGAVMYTGDAELTKWALGKTHEFLDRHQKPNGYISTYWNEDAVRGFSFWGRKYTLWALIELSRATGDVRCRKASVKLMDHMIAQLDRLGTNIWQTGSWHGVSSMSILKPVLYLYEDTGDERYFAFARKIIRALQNPDLKQGAVLANARRKEKLMTWFPKAAHWAKAYEIMSCLEGAVHYYRHTGDKPVLDDVLAYYRHLEREELNPMRSVGLFDHFLEAAVRHNGMTELCDVIHWIRLNRELLAVTGESKYADRIEEAFYNAFLAGVSRDGRWGAHIVRSHGTRHLFAPAQTGMVHHQCCPDNMMRSYFDFASTAVAGSDGGTVSVILYSDAEAKLPGATVAVSGGYPWSDGAVKVAVSREKAGKIRFRVPSWSAFVTVNGERKTAENGWYETDAPSGRSEYSLSFDLSPRVLASGYPWETPLPPSPQKYSNTDIGVFTVHFMEWYTAEMGGLSRHEPALRVMRGPLVLAKGRLAGTPRGLTLSAFPYEYDNSEMPWKATLERTAPRPDGGCAHVWSLTLERGVEKRTFRVSDFASVSNVDDPDNWFSLWF